jgi:hypothetical protein
MAEETHTNDADDGAPAEQPERQLDQGTYEIIRNRLVKHGHELRTRLDQLNAARKLVFGSIETKLVSTDRITTAHNCIPRDMVSVGGRFIVGYNVHFGLKTAIELSDVFAVYSFADQQFHDAPLDLIGDDAFERDFKELYRFYKHATFVKFFESGPHLFMKFRIGRDLNDIKAFKWLKDGDTLRYIDSRSDHEITYPPQHDFEWRRAGRDMQEQGKFPHLSIEDLVFVETIGGDLTIKIENNTESGAGIYSEPVDDLDQSLDDAEVSYAVLGHLVLLRIRPFQERDARHFVFNCKLQEVVRIDSIAEACILLPSEHGLIFNNGYYLASGEHQTFPNIMQDLVFERRIAAPNGEDYLYIFYNRQNGVYVLMSYNLIEQKVELPTICHGFSFFDNGELAYFKAQDEPQRHHGTQIWQTPYVGPNIELEQSLDSYLYKIGNRDIVRGMAECVEILGLIDREEAYADLYIDIVKKTSDVLDAFFWLDQPDCFNLAQMLGEIKAAGQAAIGEFDKVTRIRRNTEQQISTVSGETRDLINTNAARVYDHISAFVESLSALRGIRGRIIALRELRYIDVALTESLEQEVQGQTESLSRRAVAFLLEPESLAPYQKVATEHAAGIERLTKVTDARALEERISQSAADLELLIEIVSNLKIEDATQRTAIIDSISTIFSQLNATRNKLRNKTQELARVEGVAEFNSQLKLLNQSVANYLDLCQTPDKTEAYLTKLMIQIEDLEGRFAEFDEFVLQLSSKRQEVYNAFENHKLQLVEKRNRRAAALSTAADRILGGIKGRVDAFETVLEINGYFASDLMIDKVRQIIDELDDLEDSVRVDEIQSRLKTVRQDAVRQLKDRQELFVDGANVIAMGKHHFNVNTQAIDLTTVIRDGTMHLHLSGTNFFAPIEDEALNATRHVWDRQVLSESDDVYRGEYLAFLILQEILAQGAAHTEAMAKLEAQPRLEHVQRFMSQRYSEGYTKGVHDADAARILGALLEMTTTIGLLRYPSPARALALMFWRCFDDQNARQLIASRLRGFGSIANLFPDTTKQALYISELRELIGQYAQADGVFDPGLAEDAGEYLFHELVLDRKGFAVSPEALEMHDSLESHLKQKRSMKLFDESIEGVRHEALSHFLLLRDWVLAFSQSNGQSNGQVESHFDEVAVFLLDGKVDRSRAIHASVQRDLPDMIGTHRRLVDSTLHLHYNEFVTRLGKFVRHDVPEYESFIELKRQCVDAARDEMRLEEFRPRVLTSFVRNKLIDQVFLPMIGANLAKQLGVAGEAKRTDRMGLLMLVSPPGYGKTTLMEYIANRLGIVFMKINGPAIGHGVRSLDPSEATNAAARQELKKLNLAFEMGDNVMIYVDDIQHCHSEFLQKFISLCDAQRKVEGIYKGRSRTYDLRGRKVAVVMAGNPYTESGQRFRIPDMLANRADTYNLGDIIGAHGEAFLASYLENSLTSNPTLNKLASGSQNDVYAVMRIAETKSRQGVEFEGNYASEDIEEMVTVMTKLIAVRDVIFKVNQEYIRSAAMEEQYRTEPPFQLQGSYRNMNRIAERIVPIMNDQELQTLIDSSYEQDAQTLTSGAESNLLRYGEMMGRLDEAEAERWEQIKRTFQRNNALKGVGGDDRTAQILSQMAGFNQGLGDIQQVIGTAVETLSQTDTTQQSDPDRLAAVLETMGGFSHGLDAINAAISRGVDSISTANSAGPAGSTDLKPLLEKMSDFVAATESIRQSLDQGMATLAKSPAEQAPPVEARSDPKMIEAIGALTEQLKTQFEATPPAPAPIPGAVAAPDDVEPEADDAPPARQIKIINKIPATFLYVLKEQFKLMEGWLEPMMRATTKQDKQMTQLRQVLENVAHKYEQIIKRLEKQR